MNTNMMMEKGKQSKMTKITNNKVYVVIVYSDSFGAQQESIPK